MSEERSGSPVVTPTFQAVLNTNLLDFTKALNSAEYATAYDTLRTVVGMLKEPHQTELKNNGFIEVAQKINKAMQYESVDLYQTRRHRKFAVEQILSTNLRRLFSNVMLLLHKHGYLEQKGPSPRRPSKDKVMESPPIE